MKTGLALLLVLAVALPAWAQPATPRAPSAPKPPAAAPKQPAQPPARQARSPCRARGDGRGLQLGRRPGDAGGGQREHGAQARHRRLGRAALPRVLRRRVLRSVLQAPSARGRALDGLGRHCGSIWIHLDEQPRYRERSGHHGAPLRLPEVHGHAGRTRSQDRHRGPEGRGPDTAAGGAAGRLRSAAGRAVGHRDRQPVRPGPHRHRRDRVGHRAQRGSA